jgi:hypothetical protein
MKQFLTNQLETFIREADAFLESEYSLVVIGGAAAALAYHISKATTDIDVTGGIPEQLDAAFKRAAQSSGIEIPVTTVGVFEAPYHYEDRLVTLAHLKLKRLTIRVPEKHDLALMKTVRGYENDIQAIQEMHRLEALSYDVLLARFKSEMTQVSGRHDVIRLNFLATIAALFGQEKADVAKVETENWGLIGAATANE